MRDPHVVALRYALRTDGTVVFQDPAEVRAAFPGFSVRLANDRAHVEFEDHFPEVSAARSYVEPYLEWWSLIEAEGRIRFDFEGGSMIDRAESTTSLRGTATMGASALIATSEPEYPAPPAEPFLIAEEVDAMLILLRRYQDGGKTIAELGYHTLTLLERRFGGRSPASKAIRVSGPVLRRLGELTSEVGDARTGRKAGRERRPHTPAETAWIEAVVEAVIVRLGTYENDPDAVPAQLTMAGLLRLP